MADISFLPSFTNTDFVDDVDVVLAGKANPQPGDPIGFNARFTRIQADLQQLSLVVAQVDTVLSEGNAGPIQHRVTLPPTLVPPEGISPWVIGNTGAASVTPGSSATGVLNVSLPAGARLLSFRALGAATGAVATISFNAIAFGGGTVQTLASVSGDASPFDRSKDIDASVPLTTPSTTRYFVGASVPTTPSTASVTIAAFQIVYSTD